MHDQRVVRRASLCLIDSKHGGGARCICAKPVHSFCRERYGDVAGAQLRGSFEQMSRIWTCFGEFDVPIFKEGLPWAAEHELTNLGRIN